MGVLGRVVDLVGSVSLIEDAAWFWKKSESKKVTSTNRNFARGGERGIVVIVIVEVQIV